MSPAAASALAADAQAIALSWYSANGRDLAFRRTTDPWAILVSEVMAQQTQAARAAEAWTRFMAQFPTPASLAGASPATVIRAWRGLGYNRRALALRTAAIAIVEGHGGRVPDDVDALQRLPGIGPYTARAVLAIAFNRPVAALDVNIRRVIQRAFLDPDGLELQPRDLQASADALVPANDAAAWTHALMDIGAAFCRPRHPRCEACPLRASCRYAAVTSAQRPGASKASEARAPRRSPRFAVTTRWLRGRILDRLRDTPDGTWATFEGPIGEHGHEAVLRSLARLSAEGLIEADGDRARLGIG
ncbi:MAG TPA: A/G-specific adenine glycosylase [Candidatus Limnocylindrales bacterium]